MDLIEKIIQQCEFFRMKSQFDLDKKNNNNLLINETNDKRIPGRIKKSKKKKN